MSQISGNADHLAYADPGTPTAEPRSVATFAGLPLDAWAKIGVVSGLFVALFWPNLRRLWEKTNPIYGEANWGHSIAVPLIGLYFLYLNRDALLAARTEPLLLKSSIKGRLISVGALLGCAVGAYFIGPELPGFSSFGQYFRSLGMALGLYAILALLLNWGIGSILFGLIAFAAGIWPVSNDYVKDVGMVITLFGVVLTLCGWGVMRVAWFPIAFLICALPLPGLLYSQIALPLQHLAAKVAVQFLQLADVVATYSGTKITIGWGTPDSPARTLNVAEACAGMRSLMTFISVGAAVAFLSTRPLWQRLIITLSAIPIAIFCNVMRVTGQGFLEAWGYHDMASGFAHQFVGLVMLIPAFLLIMLVSWIMDQLFIEEVDINDALLKRAAVVQPGVIELRKRAKPETAASAIQVPKDSQMSSPVPVPAVAKAVPAVKPASPSSVRPVAHQNPPAEVGLPLKPVAKTVELAKAAPVVASPPPKIPMVIPPRPTMAGVKPPPKAMGSKVVPPGRTGVSPNPRPSTGGNNA